MGRWQPRPWRLSWAWGKVSKKRESPRHFSDDEREPEADEKCVCVCASTSKGKEGWAARSAKVWTICAGALVGCGQGAGGRRAGGRRAGGFFGQATQGIIKWRRDSA